MVCVDDTLRLHYIYSEAKISQHEYYFEKLYNNSERRDRDRRDNKSLNVYCTVYNI